MRFCVFFHSFVTLFVEVWGRVKTQVNAITAVILRVISLQARKRFKELTAFCPQYFSK
jgi:hypothetical protein